MAMLKVPVYGEVHIPEWVVDLNSFRKWVHSGVLPEKLPVQFIAGEVWVDFYMEEAFTHNLVKGAIYRSVDRLVEEAQLGVVFADGMLLTNETAGLGAEPDMMFVSFRSLATKRVRFAAGETTGAEATEMIGTPDLVAEVVSPSSEDKDTEKLMSQYYDAGIPEYWLIDARGGTIQFDIFKYGPKGYRASRWVDGWVKSKVLDRSFRLTRAEGKLGIPVYSLEVR
jgi:Uma2 family endonuclease